MWKDHAVALGHTRSLLIGICSQDDTAPRYLLVPAIPQPLLALYKDLAFMVSRDSPSKPCIFPPLTPSYPGDPALRWSHGALWTTASSH